MRANRILLLLTLVVFIQAQAVSDSNTGDIVRDERVYSAYGQKWKYSSILHTTRNWEFFTSHGIVGRVERVRQELLLSRDDGEVIPVQDRLYALQKDGSYKKVECCYDNNTLGDVFSVNDELFVRFLQERFKVTDCFVHPAWKPDNDKLPPGEQVRWTEFYGEFDPVKQVFYIRSFNKGVDMESSIGPDWKKWWANASVAESVSVQYLNRTPFICGAAQE